MLEMKVASQESEIQALHNKEAELEANIEEFRDEMRKLKRARIIAERKNKQYEEEQSINTLSQVRKTGIQNNLQVQLQVLTKECQSLTAALADSENQCAKLLIEKQNVSANPDAPIKQQSVKFFHVNCADFLKQNDSCQNKVYTLFLNSNI